VANPYDLLGVREGVSLEELKLAWKRIAKETHPDKRDSDDTRDFVVAREAYELLLKSIEDGIPVPYIPVEPTPPSPPCRPTPPRRARPPRDPVVEQVAEGRRRRAREAAYLAGQATLEVAYRGYGYWTRAGLPKWRTR
jgi:hypothetical protein